MRPSTFKAIAIAAFTTMVAIPSASAADLAARPYTKAPVMVEVYNWTGFYIGGNAGYSWGRSSTDVSYFNTVTGAPIVPPAGSILGSSFDMNGGIAGGQFGYNYQFGYGLFGIEADVNRNSSFKNSVIGGANSNAMTVGIKANVSGTIRARAGLVMNNVLIYVTGGAAWADIKQTGVEFTNRTTSTNFGLPTGITANASSVGWGGVIGAGVEFAVSQNWSVGGEFLHTTYADHDAPILEANGSGACGTLSNCVVRGQLTTDVGRIRLNYKFAP